MQDYFSCMALPLYLVSGIWFLPRKAGSIRKVTEDLSLENLRQELEVEKA
jgi:hypothetical protein